MPATKTMLLLLATSGTRALGFRHELVTAGCAELPALTYAQSEHMLPKALTSQETAPGTVLIDNAVVGGLRS